MRALSPAAYHAASTYYARIQRLPYYQKLVRARILPDLSVGQGFYASIHSEYQGDYLHTLPGIVSGEILTVYAILGPVDSEAFIRQVLEDRGSIAIGPMNGILPPAARDSLFLDDLRFSLDLKLRALASQAPFVPPEE